MKNICFAVLTFVRDETIVITLLSVQPVSPAMAEQIVAGEKDWLLSERIWSDEKCFQSINGDLNFYLDEDTRLPIFLMSVK